MDVYHLGAIVVCGGADSLSGDRLGCFNLSLDGHAHCMDFLAKFGVPMLVLGGGGYTMRNVARCWAYETGRLLGQELPDECAHASLCWYFVAPSGSYRQWYAHRCLRQHCNATCLLIPAHKT